MPDKKLKIKRIFTYTIYNFLRSVPPKEYPTTGEIKVTISSIMPALKEHLSAYMDLMKRVDDMTIATREKKMTEEQSKKKLAELNEEFRKYNLSDGLEVVEVSLDEEGMKTLRMQFDRDNWGKTWVANIEEFGELEAAFTEATK